MQPHMNNQTRVTAEPVQELTAQHYSKDFQISATMTSALLKSLKQCDGRRISEPSHSFQLCICEMKLYMVQVMGRKEAQMVLKDECHILSNCARHVKKNLDFKHIPYPKDILNTPCLKVKNEGFKRGGVFHLPGSSNIHPLRSRGDNFIYLLY